MFAVLLLTTAVQAAVAPPVPAPVAVALPKPKKDRQICRPVRDSVSRIGSGRECHTAAQWRTMGDDVDGHALDRENYDTRTVQNAGPR